MIRNAAILDAAVAEMGRLARIAHGPGPNDQLAIQAMKDFMARLDTAAKGAESVRQ